MRLISGTIVNSFFKISLQGKNLEAIDHPSGPWRPGYVTTRGNHMAWKILPGKVYCTLYVSVCFSLRKILPSWALTSHFWIPKRPSFGPTRWSNMPYYSNDTINFIQQNFPGNLISPCGDISWPVRYRLGISKGNSFKCNITYSGYLK